MTNVLLCDMATEYYKEELSGFIDLAKRLVGWEFSYIHDFNHYQGTPENWLNDVRTKIRECDLLVSFRGMDFLKITGSFKDELTSLLVERLRNGTPIFARLMEQNVRFSQSNKEDLMTPICKELGVSALQYRVYSDTERPDDDPNPYCTLFKKASDTLRDPQLFRGVSEVYADFAGLIGYEPDLFALIDVDPSTYKFVDDGDLIFRGSLGMKNTIAVRGDHFESLQILYTGRLFENSYFDLFERKHFGIEKNIRLAENIIRCLDDAVAKPSDHVRTCYELFSQLERRLGLLIESKLKNDQILAWIEDNSEHAGYPRVNLGQVNFIELVSMVCSYWQSFSKDIQLDKEEFRVKCNAINKRERRYLAHPIKAETDGYVFSESSSVLIRQVLEALR